MATVSYVDIFRELVAVRLQELGRFNGDTVMSYSNDAVVRKHKEIQEASSLMLRKLRYKEAPLNRKLRAARFLERCQWRQSIVELEGPTGLAEALSYALH
jgi:hypothetical protein